MIDNLEIGDVVRRPDGTKFVVVDFVDKDVAVEIYRPDIASPVRFANPAMIPKQVIRDGWSKIGAWTLALDAKIDTLNQTARELYNPMLEPIGFKMRHIENVEDMGLPPLVPIEEK